MPFTPSHAVVALPFARTRLVPAAVAIGAMTPDLPLFLRGMVPDYAMTHDLAWLPVTVVVALVLLLVWRCVLRPAARELAPRAVADRLPRSWDGGARAGLSETFGGGAAGILWLALALALGVVTHIVWDLFTHEGRFGTRLVPVLDAQLGPLPLVKWAQYGSGVLGLVIMATFAAVWLSRRPAVPAPRVLPDAVRIVWWVSLPVALVGAAVGAVAVHGPFDAEFTPTHVVYGVLTRVAAAWACATVLLAVSVQVVRRLRTSA